VKNSLLFNFLLANLALICSSSEVFAQCNNEPVVLAQPTTRIYFSQGMHSDSDKAFKAVQLLCYTQRNTLEGLRDESFAYNNEQFIFFAALNPTTGPISDLAQVLQQKAEELGITDDGLTAEEIYNWIIGDLSEEQVKVLINNNTSIENPILLDFLITKENLTFLSERLAEAIPEQMIEERRVSTEHLSQYLGAINLGERVFVIAYSQGNLFTNKVVNLIRNSPETNTDGIKILGVATPASANTVSDNYITALDDEVINILRSAIPDVALGTTDNIPGAVEDFRDITKHFFEQSYYSSPAGVQQLLTRTEINLELEELAATTPFPNKTSTSRPNHLFNPPGCDPVSPTACDNAGNGNVFGQTFIAEASATSGAQFRIGFNSTADERLNGLEGIVSLNLYEVNSDGSLSELRTEQVQNAGDLAEGLTTFSFSTPVSTIIGNTYFIALEANDRFGMGITDTNSTSTYLDGSQAFLLTDGRFFLHPTRRDTSFAILN